MLENRLMCMRPHFHDVVLLTRVTIIIFFLDGSAGILKRACMNLTTPQLVMEGLELWQKNSEFFVQKSVIS